MRFDILIVGAGLAGASLAAAFRGSRYRIALIEGRPPAPAPSGWDSRIYAVSPAAQGFLQEIGAWQHLDAARLTPVYDMAIRGDAEGRLDFSSYDSGVGELAWIVESGLTQRELWETVKRQGNLALFCPAQPQQLQVRGDAVLVGLTSGETLEAKLVVGADGAPKFVRSGPAPV